MARQCLRVDPSRRPASGGRFRGTCERPLSARQIGAVIRPRTAPTGVTVHVGCRPRPPELGAYVDAGEPGIWPSCVLAIRPPAYLAAVLGMSGS